MNKRKTGQAYEQQAVRYLEGRGYTILERNYRCRAGEIDLIAKEGGYLVFIEVKFRADEKMGYGMESVDASKQRRICRVAGRYLLERRIPDGQLCRLDVVSFAGADITLLQDAFWCD